MKLRHVLRSLRVVPSQPLVALGALAVAAGCGGAQHPSGSSANGDGDVAASAQPVGSMTPAAAANAGNNVLWNGDFEEGSLQPWSSGFSSPAAGTTTTDGGEVCFKIQNGGTYSYDVILRQRGFAIKKGHNYTVQFKARASAPTKIRPRLGPISDASTEYWSAVVDLSAQPQTFSGSFLMAKEDQPTGEFAIHFGGDLAAKAPVDVCLDDIVLGDPEFEIPEARKVGPLQKVRVNQLGYLPQYGKRATAKNPSKTPLDWQLVDAGGKAVATGKTKVFGDDPASGEHVHQIDFSSFKTQGKGYVLKVGEDASVPFDIRPDLYNDLKYDALAFFYHQRSGMPITMPYAGEEKWTRPAAHTSDRSVPCMPGKCDYSLDVSGGWYDAGDHGKYVVNAGITVWTLQNQYERAKYLGSSVGDFGDGKLKIPEHKNKAPDLLDEVRYELEFMMKMQVPAGKPNAGMVHHKIHSEKWTDIPTQPDKDTVKRYLHPVSTAATLNLAGVAAQCARIWRGIDNAFADKCKTAAEQAWLAAVKQPRVYAPGSDNVGGGPYGDGNTDDEFYWAAAELYITTGNSGYHDYLVKQRFHKSVTDTAGGGTSSMSWDTLGALGTISIAVVPSKFDKATVGSARQQLIAVADKYLGHIERRGYRVPVASDSRSPWGSNSFILNNMVVMGLAYDFTKQPKYVEGVIDSMDYILGRNPMVQSYVTGYGTRPLLNPHHRFWAKQANDKFPPPPPGIVSGGPNSSIEDPHAKASGLGGCPPQKCFIDHIQSWSTNEIAINWNAPFAWAVAFLDERGEK